MPRSRLVTDPLPLIVYRGRAKSGPPPLAAYDILGFCLAHSISEGMYYKLKKAGAAPREMKVGTRTLISMKAAEEWRKEREKSPGILPAPLD